MEPKKNDRLKDLVKELANTINTVFTASEEIKGALKGIEDEGYRVDLILASITRILPKDRVAWEEQPIYEFNDFDKAFLRALKIRMEADTTKE